MPSGSAEIQLTCGHRKHFDVPVPLKGDTIFCIKCNAYFAVLTDVREEYRIRCTVCRYGRQYGTDKVNAEFSAGKHATNRGHKVALYKGDRFVSEIGPEGIDSRTQERQALSKQAQQLLKVFVTKP